jgi:hypothetical protein
MEIDYNHKVRFLRSVLLVALLAPAALWAQSAPVLAPPAYGNSVYLFVDTPLLFGSDAGFQPEADLILAALHGGPYARVGSSSFLLIDLPWAADLTNPVLSSPTPAFLSAALSRAQARGLAVHIGAVAGVSRAVTVYEPARREDRRNAQWYMDGSLQKSSIDGINEIWMTPSRYARKLRRHLETKVRAFARVLIAMRQQFPDTMVSASGDGEMELNYGGLDESAMFDSQMIADYSPFAIAEFRDWIRHTGLYGTGQPYGGQGFSGGGAQYQGAGGLSNLNAAYGTAFASWNLLYFDWDVTADPVDGDTKAIPDTTYQGAGWTPLPSSGPDFVAGGFDAPRRANSPSSAFWALWKQFRQTLIGNYQKDFATWVTTTADTGGNRFGTDRWYSHQVPADYLNETFPGCPVPNVRLMTSASPLTTANTAPAGSLGVTAFDVFGSDGIYHRTSRYLLPALKAMNLPNWGFVEWNPSWQFIPDPDVAGIAATAGRAYEAGAHILNYVLWDLFITTNNPQALDLFLSNVKNQPRDAGTVAYAPPQAWGLTGRWFSTTVALSWSDLAFPGVAGFRFFDWAPFARFEVWRGASATFGTADGEKVGDATAATLAGITPDVSKPFYRVRAVTSGGAMGAFSDAISPLPPSGSAFFTLAPCRVLDTRDQGAPLGGPAVPASTRLTYTLTNICGIPAGARAVSANVTVISHLVPGFVRFLPGDTASTSASTLSFSPGQVRGNNAILSLSEAGTLAAENVSLRPLDIVVDVNGYFR